MGDSNSESNSESNSGSNSSSNSGSSSFSGSSNSSGSSGSSSSSNSSGSSGSSSSSNSSGSSDSTPPPRRLPRRKVEPKAKEKDEFPRIGVPRDSETFFRAKKKFPTKFVFTPEGDLQVPAMKGEAAKVIKLPFYTPTSMDEKAEIEKRRKEELILLEQTIDETEKLLKEAIETWRATGAASDVLRLQKELEKLDAQRTLLRSPMRWTKDYFKLEIRQLDFENMSEKRKLKKTEYATALRLRSFRFDELVKGSMETPPTTEEPEDDVEELEGEEAESFIVFFDPADPEHGVLSPDTLVEFIHNSTKYTSLTQAYEVERVTMLGRKDVRPILLGKKTPAKVRSLGTGVKGDVENPFELWTLILKSLLAQNPRTREILEATGEDVLVYADPANTKLGVGLPADDPAILERSEWKGENLLGRAWMSVRDGLKLGDEEGSGMVGGGAYTEHGKTEEEAKKQRAGILKGVFSRKAY